VLKKSITKPNDVQYSVRDRLMQAQMAVGVSEKVLVAMVHLSVLWRNRLVHSAISKGPTHRNDDEDRLQDLSEASGQLSKTYGGLQVEEMLQHFRQKESPKRKEIVALISSCQNAARSLDVALIRAGANTQEKIAAIAVAALKSALIAGTNKPSELSKLWGKDRVARRRRLHSILEESGFTHEKNFKEKEPVSSPLSIRFIEDFVSMSKAEATDFLYFNR
jgi:hypothetical protein